MSGKITLQWFQLELANITESVVNWKWLDTPNIKKPTQPRTKHKWPPVDNLGPKHYHIEYA